MVQRDRQIAHNQLFTIQCKHMYSIVGLKRNHVRRGAISLSDCWDIEPSIGNLHFHVVEYGDAIHLRENYKDC